jgi:hypothetical protein
VRRILLVLTAALVMAAMVVAMAAPAFARLNCDNDLEPGATQTCVGGEGQGPGGINSGPVGGTGMNTTGHCDPDPTTDPPCTQDNIMGGGGGQVPGESQGGTGFRCDPYPDCVGEGFTGGPA